MREIDLTGPLADGWERRTSRSRCALPHLVATHSVAGAANCRRRRIARTDEVHANRIGYDRVAAALVKTLVSFVNQRPTHSVSVQDDTHNAGVLN